MANEDKVTYTFTYVDNNDAGPEFPVNVEHSAKFVFDSATTWNAVLNQFVHFLEGIYGYNISDQVHTKSFEDRLADLEIYAEETDEDTPSST
jgi:hypothetical protein